jgi:multiple sugar transport system substrate-binding protein
MKKVLSFFLVLTFVLTVFSVTTITISGWPGNPTEEAAIKEAVEVFNSENSDVQIKWDPIPGDYKQALLTRLSAGTGPDIFYVDIYYFEELARKNVLLPLDLYIQKENFDVDDFYQNLIDGFTFNERLYGLPKDFSTLVLYYNKEIFDKYDVPYPTEHDTYEDMLAKAELLKSSGFETPMVLAADFNRVIPFIHAFGGEIVNEDMSQAITSDKSLEAIEFYTDLVNKYEVAFEPSNVGSGWIGEAIAAGKVAMAMSGPWTKGFIDDQYPNMSDKIDMTLMPKDEERASMIYTVSWSINRQTQNREAAWKVLKFLTNEGQKIFTEKTSILASRKSIAENARTPENKVFYDSVEFGYPWSVPTPSGVFSKANDQLNSMLKDLMYEKITIEEFANRIENNYQEWVQSN